MLFKLKISDKKKKKKRKKKSETFNFKCYWKYFFFEVAAISFDWSVLQANAYCLLWPFAIWWDNKSASPYDDVPY